MAKARVGCRLEMFATSGTSGDVRMRRSDDRSQIDGVPSAGINISAQANIKSSFFFFSYHFLTTGVTLVHYTIYLIDRLHTFGVIGVGNLDVI